MDELLPFDKPPADEATGDLTVTGTLAGITFRNEDNGWTVARFDGDELPRIVTVVGNMPGVEEGDSLALVGRWIEHKTYGKQFAVESCRLQLPTGRKGVLAFLGGGRIKGVGPATAEKIVDALGVDVLQRLQRDPDLIKRVPGIGLTKAETILEQLHDQQESAAVMVFLAELGLGAALSQRVWRRFKSDTIALVRNDPYCLAEEVSGIGFRTADGMARSLGHAADSAFRVAAGLQHLLARAALDGHVGLPAEELLESAARFLEVEERAVEQVLIESLRDKRLTEDVLIYRPELHEAECRIAKHARRLLEHGEPPTDLAPSAAVRRAVELLALNLAPDQEAALETALSSPFSVITGGPGVGKTTIIRGLYEVLCEQGCRVELAAPTGRAARRLSDATGGEARTLHRMLGLRPAGELDAAPRDNPLEADVLIVDEVSMVDVTLMAVTLEALPDGCALVLVGDVDQLPSVGPGDVLAAFVHSDTVPVARLTSVFRQAKHSGIVRVAHEWNAGSEPTFDEGPDGQAFFIERRRPEDAVTAVLAMASERIPQRFDLDPVSGVQVITPMHKGPLGTIALNELLRETLNPAADRKAEIKRFGRLFREGDKVMQVKNNYDLDVFNGDIGIVRGVHEQADRIDIDFDGRRKQYGLDLLDQLEPAFAITCHKSQGSEFPAVILPLNLGQHIMLRRNLVYTAFTRAKQVLVAVGEPQALKRALATVDTGTRHGRLAERLRGEEGDPDTYTARYEASRPKDDRPRAEQVTQTGGWVDDGDEPEPEPPQGDDEFGDDGAPPEFR